MVTSQLSSDLGILDDLDFGSVTFCHPSTIFTVHCNSDTAVTPDNPPIKPISCPFWSKMWKRSFPVSVTRILHEESVTRQPGLNLSPTWPPPYLVQTPPHLSMTSRTLAWQSETHRSEFLFSSTNRARSPGVKRDRPSLSYCISCRRLLPRYRQIFFWEYSLFDRPTISSPPEV